MIALQVNGNGLEVSRSVEQIFAHKLNRPVSVKRVSNRNDVDYFNATRLYAKFKRQRVPLWIDKPKRLRRRIAYSDVPLVIKRYIMKCN